MSSDPPSTWTDVLESLKEHPPMAPKDFCLGIADDADDEVGGDVLLDIVSEIEPQLRGAVDVLALEISRGSQIQPQSPNISALLSLRYAWACGLAETLAESERVGSTSYPPKVGVEWTTTRKMRYLMVDSWAQIGCRSWFWFGWWAREWSYVPHQVLGANH